MKKNQIITIIVIIVLVFAGVVGWFLMQKEKIADNGENGQEQEEAEEVFSLSAIISSVDIANNFMMVKPVNQEEEIKIVVSDTAKLIKVEFPFDPTDPPKEGSFSPVKTEITISDFQEGDNIFVKSKEDIFGKTEISNIDFIHILP